MPNTSETPWTIACQAPLHGIFQARILEWVAISSCRAPSWPRDQIHVSRVSYIDRQILNHWAVWEALSQLYICIYPLFLDFFPIYAITEYWIEVPVLYSKSLLVVYFTYITVYISIPTTQFISPPPCVPTNKVNTNASIWWKFNSHFLEWWPLEIISRFGLGITHTHTHTHINSRDFIHFVNLF